MDILPVRDHSVELPLNRGAVRYVCRTCRTEVVCGEDMGLCEWAKERDKFLSSHPNRKYRPISRGRS